jgi:hypothetical protein
MISQQPEAVLAVARRGDEAAFTRRWREAGAVL